MLQWPIGNMEGSGTINLRTLTMEELAGVVNLYPWFAAARKELCVRMSALGGESWGVGQYADQAMYVADRSIISGIMRSSAVKDYSDSDLETLLSSYMEESRSGDAAEPAAQPARAARPVPGGDFFSKDEYDKVRRAGDNFTFRARTAGNLLQAMPKTASVSSSAQRHWRKFMPNRAILSSRKAFIANFFWHSRKKVLTLHPLLKNWTN